MEVKKIKIDSLLEHPVHKTTYSSDARVLMESIEKVGQLVPIVINAKNEVLSGWLRLLALKALNETEIEAILRDNLNEDEETLYIISFNNQRKKSTLEIWNEISKLKSYWGKKKGTRTDLSNELSPDGSLHTRDRIAQALQISPTYVGKISAIAETDPVSLALIDSGECSINEVYNQVKQPKIGKTPKAETIKESTQTEGGCETPKQVTSNSVSPQAITKLFKHQCPNCGHQFN